MTSGIDSVRSVLRQEARALETLADALDGALSQALDILGRASGRVIVTGMGKSGHVGHKIASTLASTGTPAQFVHPAEASHGDLGMITAQDVVLALSNSGETTELADLLAYTRRFGIPLIAITGRSGSALGQAADVTILLPALPEAGSMGLAPTTSTTMMLALGDALAVALLEKKGFTAEDFRAFHPGGKLGAQLLKVSDLMHRDDEVPLAPRNMRMGEAILIMSAKTFGVVGIVDEAGLLCGIITDGDLRRHMGKDLLDMTAEGVMTPHPLSIRPQALASEAVHLMNAKAVTSLFVLDQGKPSGIIRLHDCLAAGVG
ncbi:MAG TPA: KpsF/GutQ family sugar-phosphate isomerase [Dongiaceae bacterium]|jgi:arabinose-5-phosphate isomerase|nr:KpsF/GutQ family sugar-phosphate isomerase [Dongiaceae bacterium]